MSIHRLHRRLSHIVVVRARDDRGVAMITALMAVLVLTALGAIVATVGVNNLTSATRDRQAGSSLGAGDAGVAQAIEYLRNNSVNAFTCPETAGVPAASCSSNPAGWSNPSNPQRVPLDSAGTGCTGAATNCAKVWIGVVVPFAPPATKYGIFNIHSEGLYGAGPSARRLVVTVKVTPTSYPIGVFGRTTSGNGGTQILTESLFTTACVSPLDSGSGNGTRFTGIDDYWGQPAAAHSTDHISTSVNCKAQGYISSSSPAGSASDNHCPGVSAENTMQSGLDGGLVSSTAGAACYHQYQRLDGSWYPDAMCPAGVTSIRPDGLCDSTAFTTADLKRYGYRARGLADSDYSALQARAQAQGLYDIPTGNVAAALSADVAGGINDPVIYWDCSQPSSNCSSGSVTLHQSDLPSGYFQDAPTTPPAACPSPLRVLTIVVEHGDMTFQGGNNQWLDAAVFVPDGNFQGNGGYNILGTLFSNNIDLGGNQAWALDACWVKSFPGPISNVKQVGFREDDATDAP